MQRGRGRATVAAVVLLAGLAALFALSAGPARSTSTGTPRLSPRVVTTWPWVDPYGCFAEGMALGRDGNLYASVTTWGDEVDLGQIVRIAPGTGQQSQFGPTIETPGLLTGVAFDQYGRLYVANATFSEDQLPGVFRVDAGKLTRVLTLPADSFPNGLAFHGGYMFVSDSALGAIWRSLPDTPSIAVSPWFQDERLAPTGQEGIGANGIAFRAEDLYVAVADPGRLVRISLRPNGLAGALRLVSARPELRTVDGIAFDLRGNLWLTANGPDSGRLLMLSPIGQLTVAADRPAWLDYPTQPVVGSGSSAGTLYVENGSYETSWMPTVIALPGLLAP